MERMAPARLEVAAENALPGIPYRGVGGRAEIAEQHRQDLVHRADVVEGRDERLDDGRCAVDGASVAPALETVGERQLPFA
jgi:hypothetical protein